MKWNEAHFFFLFFMSFGIVFYSFGRKQSGFFYTFIFSKYARM